MIVEEQICISRPAQSVWDYVVDHENDPQWCSKVRRVERTGQATWNVWHVPIPLRSAQLLQTTHVAANPPARLRIREQDATSVFEVDYRLEPTAHGTLFTQVSCFRWNDLRMVCQRLLALGVRRDVRCQLRALKRQLEQTGS